MEEDKKIDEAWKERAEKERANLIDSGKEKNLEADFRLFLSSLGLQAMVALGEMENPVTNRKTQDLTQAKYLIDTLGILEEKTKNNLNKEEKELLDSLLYQLRIIYIAKTK